VEDVSGASITINRDGKLVRVPMEKDTNLQIKETLKLAGASIAVDNLKFERAFAPGSDPFLKVAQAAAMAAGETAVEDLARGEVMRADTQVMGANIQLNALRGTRYEGEGRAAVAAADARMQSAQADLMATYNGATSQFADVSARAADAGSELSQELFDAIRISFEVTADQELKQPYYAVIAQIRERDAKPGHVRKWAYVKPLGTLKPGRATNVTVYQSGLPRGYILESCEVHLYEGGKEFATNLSSKRVDLTEEEALEFRIIEYVAENKGQTLQAAPAITNLAFDVRASLTKAHLEETCYVRVAKDGRVTAAFSDAAGKKPLKDDALESALMTLRFNPALEAGKPVESIAPIKLGEFTSL
jgi:hypothetical protein